MLFKVNLQELKRWDSGLYSIIYLEYIAEYITHLLRAHSAQDKDQCHHIYTAGWYVVCEGLYCQVTYERLYVVRAVRCVLLLRGRG